MALKGKIYSIARQHDDLNTNELFQSMINKSASQDTIVMDGRNIAAGSIFAEQIHANAITADHIKSGAIETDHMDAGTIDVSVLKGSQLILPGKNYGGVVINNNGISMKSTGTAKLDIKLSSASGFNITDRFNNQLIDINPSTGNVKMEVNQMTIGGYSGATTKDIDNIEVGGRNLIPDSNFDSGQPHSWNQTSYYTEVITDGIAEYKCISEHPSSRLEKFFYGLEVGQIYTLTIYAQIPVAGEWRGFVGATILSDSVITPTTDKFVKHSITFKPVQSTVTVRLYTPYCPVGAKIYMDWYKLEKGNKATDWTPAPEDIEKAYTAVAEAKANLAETQAKAHADGKVTAEEKRAIQDAEDKLEEAKKHAKKQVDDLEVGGRNLIVLSKLLVGRYLNNSNGTLGTSSSHATTDFVVARPATEYVFSGVIGVQQVRFVSYDINKNYISGVLYSGNRGDSQVYKTPANTGYIRVSADFVTRSHYNDWVLEKGNKATDWSPAPEDVEAAYTAVAVAKADLAEIQAKAHADGKVTAEEERAIQDAKDKLAEAKTHANKSIDDLEVGGVNLLVESTITRGRYFRSDGATTSDAQWFHTDFIPVKGVKHLTTSGYSNLGNSPSVTYHNSSKTFVKGINNAGQSRAKLITIDSGIEFIRFSGMIKDLPTLKIEQGKKSTTWSPSPQDVEASYTAVAEAKAELERIKAEAYADEKVTEEEERAIADAKKKLSEAKSHADDKAGDAETNAKDYAKKQVDDIEVGARNLFSVNQYASLRNSEGTTHGDRYSVGSSGALVVDGVDGSGGYDTMKMVDLKANTEYIFTFNTPINDRFSFYNTNGVAVGVTRNWSSNNTQLTFKMGSVDGYIGGKFYPIEQSYPAEIYLMAEKGNKATDWTPAPEDVSLDIKKKTYNPVRYIRDWSGGSNRNTGNHKYELQAYVEGENIARGKTVTGNGPTQSNLQVFTNGSTLTGTYLNLGNSSTPVYAQVDLGRVYYDVDSIAIWRYYNDNRTYHNTKIEVSADGTKWVPIFDSFVEGEYPETAGGRLYPNTIAKSESLISGKESMTRLGDSTSKVTISGGNIKAGTISSENNYSRINLDDGTFSFGNGRLVWNGSNMTVNGKISVTNIDGKLTDSQINSAVTWNNKETTSGAQTKANTAEGNAKKYVDDNTGNLVNNPAATGNHTGWTGSGLSSLNQTFEGVSARVLQSSTGSNIQNFSSYFKVDPSKAYEVSMWFKKSIANSSGYYFGLNGINASGSTVGFVQTSQSGGTANANNTNFYFTSGTGPTNWVKVVGYIMPVGTKPSDLKGVGTASNAIMKQNIDRIRVRFLNWSNAGTTRQLWVANPKVVEVDPNAVIYGASAKTKTDAWSYQNTTEIDGGVIRTGTIEVGTIKGRLPGNKLTLDGNVSISGTFKVGSANIDYIDAKSITVGRLSADRGLGSFDLDTGEFYSVDANGSRGKSISMLDGVLNVFDYSHTNSRTTTISGGSVTHKLLSYTSSLGAVALEFSNSNSSLSSALNYDRLSVPQLLIKNYPATSASTTINHNGITTNDISTNDISIGGASIVDSGSNENGEWVKFYDGTMICRGYVDKTLATKIAWGSLYYASVGRLTFPVAFDGVPYVQFINSSLSDVFIGATANNSSKTQTGNISIYRPVSTESAAYSIGFVAIGRWK